MSVALSPSPDRWIRWTTTSALVAGSPRLSHIDTCTSRLCGMVRASSGDVRSARRRRHDRGLVHVDPPRQPLRAAWGSAGMDSLDCRQLGQPRRQRRGSGPDTDRPDHCCVAIICPDRRARCSWARFARAAPFVGRSAHHRVISVQVTRPLTLTWDASGESFTGWPGSGLSPIAVQMAASPPDRPSRRHSRKARDGADGSRAQAWPASSDDQNALPVFTGSALDGQGPASGYRRHSAYPIRD